MNAHSSSPGSTPAPVSLRPLRVAIWLALVGGPLLWLVQLALAVTLVSAACGDGIQHQADMPWPHVEGIVGVASGGAFVIALVLAIMAGRAWRRTVSLAPDKHDALRFVAWCAAAISVLFLGLIAFSTCVLVIAPIERLCTPFQ
ncbi:conserved membrane hypothetical protein [Paraburkholderia tropica]|uniref:hypothetical protein n=1 Tax=Paraburkholderia tropica TaxID=92647 RepID=UPI001CAF43A1|nr:hypothetical protein [Paraburkholderia tropica]CAG9204828.1 conserved membrane hypothetical protein [Paraburkholderia tropica]